MALYKLHLDDFQNIDYCLYAIHTELEDYRLAYRINSAFGSKLERKNKDLGSGTHNKYYFPVFEWNNNLLDNTWNLIKNSCKIELKNKGEGLFAGGTENTTKVVPLLEDCPSANFFLKVEGQEKPSKKIVSMLSKTPDINMAYSINLDTIRSKEYLILD
tara:strand:- start:15 stop:491 length:477 start_codon:yes stop_codon:yes gene_type:complete